MTTSLTTLDRAEKNKKLYSYLETNKDLKLSDFSRVQHVKRFVGQKAYGLEMIGNKYHFIRSAFDGELAILKEIIFTPYDQAFILERDNKVIRCFAVYVSKNIEYIKNQNIGNNEFNGMGRLFETDQEVDDYIDQLLAED